MAYTLNISFRKFSISSDNLTNLSCIPSWLEADRGMNVCFCDELPGIISLLALLPLNRRRSEDFRVFFSSWTRCCGFLSFFLASLPTVRRGAPSRIEVDESGVVYKCFLCSKFKETCLCKIFNQQIKRVD